MDVTSLIVQGGALGLLTIVLILIWKYIQSRNTIEDARMQREQVRLDETIGFMKQLTEDSLRDLEKTGQSWEKLTTKTLTSLGTINKSLARVQDSLAVIHERLSCMDLRLDELNKKE